MLLFMDSFDHYMTADLGAKYHSLVNTPSIVAGAGRRGSQALQMNSVADAVLRGFTPRTTEAVIVGMAFKGAPNGYSILGIRLGTATQLTISINGSGFLVVTRVSGSGSPATPIATATTGQLTPEASFNCLEVMAVCHPTAGSVIVRANEQEVINFSGNTAGSGQPGWDGVCFGQGVSSGGGITWSYDDVYILDSVAPVNTFLGDCRIDLRIPTADGSQQDWTPSAGLRYQNVDDVPPDGPNGDTDYNSTSNPNTTDLYVMQDLPAFGSTIYGVQHCVNLRKYEVGPCAVAPVVKQGARVDAGDTVYPGTGYTYYLQMWRTNPATGNPWTEAEFNAAEFGYKRTT